MEKLDLMDTVEIGQRLAKTGNGGIKHLTRNLRAAGYTLYKVHRKRGRSGFAVKREDAEKYILPYERGDIPCVAVEPIAPTERVEDQIRKQRERDGWFSLRLSAAGMPDLLNLKPRADGLFEILFEEVKGLGDGLRKDQYATLADLRHKGIPTTVTWL